MLIEGIKRKQIVDGKYYIGHGFEISKKSLSVIAESKKQYVFDGIRKIF